MLVSLYSLSLLTLTASAGYTIVDDYTPNNFASMFNFFTGTDPTDGYVNYVDEATAQSNGLYSVSNNQVYLGADHTNVATGSGRDSVRIASKNSYQHGLIILDLAHMPGSDCASWPAFWLLSTSATWPDGGEVDIIEGVNSATTNTMTVHTDAGCTISNTGGMSGDLITSNCDINAAGQSTNEGCSIGSTNTDSYGDGFNSVGGGVYATEWTSNGISIWFFARSAIPSDITSGNPDPTGWGLPMASFAGSCDWDEKVVNQQIIFDITFCGDWAGSVWSTDTTCSSKASSCQAFVQNNPSAFAQTYWSINSLKVYQENGQASTATTGAISATSVASATTARATSTAATTTASTLSTITLTATTPNTFSATSRMTTTPTTSSLSQASATSAAPSVATTAYSAQTSIAATSVRTSNANTVSTNSNVNTWSTWAAQATMGNGDNNWHGSGGGNRGSGGWRRSAQY